MAQIALPDQAALPRERHRSQQEPPGWWRRLAAQTWWPWTRRLVLGAFALFVVSALVFQARAVDWGQVWRTMRDYPVATLALAGALAVASHVLYSSFDLIGRHYTGHKLANRSVMLITFVSYAFNLNLGTIVGAVAMRYRLYARLGLDNPTVTRIVATSMLTNWLGYLFLAGMLFSWAPLDLPDSWDLTTAALRAIGALLLALALSYLALCAFSRRRVWIVRGTEIALPRLRVALIQLALSSANWSIMGGILYVLLHGQIAYPMVLGALLTGAVAGLLSRIPAGLGILEAVFVAFFAGDIAQSALLAAVLTYRVVYYWAPLLVAAGLYMWMEARAKALRASDNPA